MFLKRSVGPLKVNEQAWAGPAQQMGHVNSLMWVHVKDYALQRNYILFGSKADS